jgi:hypothetical protein
VNGEKRNTHGKKGAIMEPNASVKGPLRGNGAAALLALPPLAVHGIGSLIMTSPPAFKARLKRLGYKFVVRSRLRARA